MLKIDKLECGYGDNLVIKGFSAEIARGEFAGIIGPNGSGKTTLIKAILKILKPSSGSISIQNRNIYRIDSGEYSRKISFLPSNIEIHFSYTIEEFIYMGRFPYTGRYGQTTEKDRQIVEEAITRFEIERYRHRKIHELSDGEKQLVFLAQAVVQQPELLILDEPTSHLDIGHQYRIMDIIQQLNSKGITIISVLHDLNLAAQYCTRLLLIKEGQLFSSGRPEDVLTYQNIEKVYETNVLVYKNPVTKKPYVFGIPETLLNQHDRDAAHIE